MGRPARYHFDDDGKAFLIQCREEVRMLKWNMKQQMGELQRRFQLKYPVCDLSGTTLYTYAGEFASALKPVVFRSTQLWPNDVVADLVKCVDLARSINTQSQTLGLQAGKRERKGSFLWPHSRLCNIILEICFIPRRYIYA